MFNSSGIFIHIVSKRDVVPKIMADQNKLWNDFVDLRKLKGKIIWLSYRKISFRIENQKY